MILTEYITLKEAYQGKKAPSSPGIYKIQFKNKLMKVGKASDGLRKRFSDYYRGKEGGTAGLKHITKDNRDKVLVSWYECKKEETRNLEIKLYNLAKNDDEDLPWSERR